MFDSAVFGSRSECDVAVCDEALFPEAGLAGFSSFGGFPSGGCPLSVVEVVLPPVVVLEEGEFLPVTPFPQAVSGFVTTNGCENPYHVIPVKNPAVAGEKSPVNLRSAKDPQSSGPKMSTAAPLESGSGNAPSTSVSPVLAPSAVVAGAAAPVGAPPGPECDMVSEVKCEKKIKNRKELKASHIRGMKTSIRQFHEFAKMADELTQPVDAHGEDTPERVLQAYVVVSG
ncbi:hypothetical protein OROGR_020113 [Orobanche gracilis]